MTPDDFKDHPRSVAEIRSDRSMNAKDWTPRDALISVLRDIDSGAVDPDALIVVYRRRDADGANLTHFRLASPDPHVTVGMLRIAEWELLAPQYNKRR